VVRRRRAAPAAPPVARRAPREIEPVEADAYARFLPCSGTASRANGGASTRSSTRSGVLQGAPLVASSLETDVLPARVRGYRPPTSTSSAPRARSSGSVPARSVPHDGRVRLFFADQLAALAPSIEPQEAPSGALHDGIRTLLAERGASFWTQLREADTGATEAELLTALWDLVWAGEVTNDSLAPLRAVIGGARTTGRSSGRPPAPGGRDPGRLNRASAHRRAQGRWSLVAPLLNRCRRPTEAAHAAAMQLLERYGVVTREAVLAERVVGGYTGVYGVLKVLEERGQARRGYFVAGLGAAQFSTARRRRPAAVGA
jgi:ATP-dependent Lhr-like helicase